MRTQITPRSTRYSPVAARAASEHARPTPLAVRAATTGDALARRPPFIGLVGPAFERRIDRLETSDAADHAPQPPPTQSMSAGSALLITAYGLAVEGFRELLRREHTMADLQSTTELARGVELARLQQPTLVVLGAECIVPHPAAALRAIRAAAPTCRILAMANRTQRQWFATLVEHGADALLMYESSADEFALGLRNVLGGVPHLDPEVQLQIMRNLGEPAQRNPMLTPRELQVLRLVARGNSNKAIGRELGLTEGTVKTYLRRLRQRLGARDRTHAVIHALSLGLVDVERG
jgi:DNA-binding NarL/FixJ family response regulator